MSDDWGATAMPHNYIICTTQRSGKTWLARTLECLGAGSAKEHVTALHRNRPEYVDAWKRGGLAGFVDAFLHHPDTLEGRPAGLSVAWNEFSWLARKADLSKPGLLDRLVELMGGDTKIVFLVRRDIVAQAVSRFLLRRTGYAHSFHSDKRRTLRATVEYDAEEISQSLAWSRQAYLSWVELLSPRAHCTLFYEDLAADTAIEVRRLLNYIDFPEDLTDAEIRRCAGETRRVGDELNQDMIDRFLGESDYQADIAAARKLVS